MEGAGAINVLPQGGPMTGDGIGTSRHKTGGPQIYIGRWIDASEQHIHLLARLDRWIQLDGQCMALFRDPGPGGSGLPRSPQSVFAQIELRLPTTPVPGILGVDRGENHLLKGVAGVVGTRTLMVVRLRWFSVDAGLWMATSVGGERKNDFSPAAEAVESPEPLSRARQQRCVSQGVDSLG